VNWLVNPVQPGLGPAPRRPRACSSGARPSGDAGGPRRWRRARGLRPSPAKAAPPGAPPRWLRRRSAASRCLGGRRPVRTVTPSPAPLAWRGTPPLLDGDDRRTANPSVRALVSLPNRRDRRTPQSRTSWSSSENRSLLEAPIAARFRSRSASWIQSDLWTWDELGSGRRPSTHTRRRWRRRLRSSWRVWAIARCG
jgi:hypothetical protein